jgi:branched-chain amino acid aminotransferase
VQHLDRLRRGAEFLRITIPFPIDSLLDSANELITRNKLPRALLRITLTRGIGPRGYSPANAQMPTLVMSLHAAPESSETQPAAWNVVISSIRLAPGDPLNAFKTCNKLPQILARMEADAAGADEAILLNTEGYAIEGASSNLFWVENETVCTSPIASGILPGVTRELILDLCRSLSIPQRETCILPAELHQTSGIFFTVSSLGVVEATSLNHRAVPKSAVARHLLQAFRTTLINDTH